MCMCTYQIECTDAVGVCVTVGKLPRKYLYHPLQKGVVKFCCIFTKSVIVESGAVTKQYVFFLNVEIKKYTYIQNVILSIQICCHLKKLQL